MSTSEIFLIAMGIIFLFPYLIWRVGRTDYYAPLVVVQIITGILFGPGILGALYPHYYAFVFNSAVVQSLTGIAWWAVMSFVWIAGIELDLKGVWKHRRESSIAAGLALGTPLALGCVAALVMVRYDGWIGPHAAPWQFILGMGMACAVTALPILILFLEKLDILRQPLGQRILRYASMDDVAIWGVLALILMDWHRIGKQLTFLVSFAIATWGFRRLMQRLPMRDRWYVGLIWLPVCGFGADWSGLHFMVGAFLAGAVMDSDWFDQAELDGLRKNVLLLIMPVFFLSTGLRTAWSMGGGAVLLVAAGLLFASVTGKLLGTRLAGVILHWQPGDSSVIGWLLQTKALIMIIFVNILLDKGVITNASFTALLLMAVGSTMLTIPIAKPKLQRLRAIISKPLISCVLISVLAMSLAGHASAQTATLILVNGKIWTENPRLPEAEAIAVDGSRIVALGSSSSMTKLAGPHCKIVDVQGRRVVPGFNDSHVHFLGGGSFLISVQLGDANSVEEFRDRLGRYAKTLPKGAWIREGNWDHQRWTPAALPSHQTIDEVTPDNPVMVWRVDGHMVLVNAVAMKLAGIDRSTQDVPGGEIVRDSEGNPTGILKDAATGLVERVLPPLSSQELDAAMNAAMHEAAFHGVTSVQNMADSSTDKDSAIKLREFQKFSRAGSLTVRIYHAAPLDDWKSLADIGVQAGFGGPALRIGNLKSFADGALGSATAWMDAPFTDQPTKSGLASVDLMDLEKMSATIRGADQAGLQISIHAIGDRAIHTVLDLFEQAKAHNGTADPRYRIEHVQHLRPADAARFAPLGVIASMQPYHAIDDGRWAEKSLGPERTKSSYAWRSLLDKGAVLAFGSDWPVAPLDPLMGIYAAATRRTLDGKNPNGWVPEQRITVAEAVHAYTMGSAFAERQEAVKGSLEPGKLADLVVLSADIFQIAPTAIEKTRVYMTVFDGTVIYQARSPHH